MSNATDMPMLVTKADIIGLDDRPVTPFVVTAWGRTVYVRALDAAAAVGMADAKDVGAAQRAASVVQRGLVDEHGRELFAAADVDALLAKSVAAVMEIAAEILRLSKPGTSEGTPGKV